MADIFFAAYAYNLFIYQRFYFELIENYVLGSYQDTGQYVYKNETDFLYHKWEC